MTRKSRFSLTHAHAIRCYLRRQNQWEMRRSLITSREYEKDTFLPLSGLALIIALAVIYFWGRKKLSHSTYGRKEKFYNKTSFLPLKLVWTNRLFSIHFLGRKKFSHFTRCHKVKFYGKTSASRNKSKYVSRYSIYSVCI